jgi:hypothetical protein
MTHPADIDTLLDATTCDPFPAQPPRDRLAAAVVYDVDGRRFDDVATATEWWAMRGPADGKLHAVALLAHGGRLYARWLGSRWSQWEGRA